MSLRLPPLKPLAASRRPFFLLLLSGLALAGCRTCPIDSCHIRKAHYHEGVKYRARPIWKMQYPAVGERIRLNRQAGDSHKESNRARPLK